MTRTRQLKVLIFLIGTLKLGVAWSQIQNIHISEEVTIDKLYMGLLANTRISTTDLKQSSHLTFQAGGRIQLWLIPNFLQVRSLGVLKVIAQEPPQGFTNFESIITPNRRFAIHVGVMATSITELRPNPSTWQSQVETNAESTIPGGRPGAKVNYMISDAIKLSYGLHNQDGSATHHLKVVVKSIAVSSFINNQSEMVAVRWSYKEAQLVGSYDSESVALSAIIPVMNVYRIYSDLAFDERIERLTFSELGIRRHFHKEGFLSGFFSISYNYTLKYTQGGFFLHI